MIKRMVAIMALTASTVWSQGKDIPGETVPRGVPAPRLFEELNYELPGLAGVKAAWDRGDENGAKAALLTYFRSREDVVKPGSSKTYDTTLADELLKGRFVWGDMVLNYGPTVADIAWYKVPMDIHWPTFDHEIGRGTYVYKLGKAYCATGDDRYVEHLVKLMLEFIKDCPVEQGRAMPRINNMDGYAVRLIGREALATDGHPAMYWTLMAAMRRTQQWARFFQYCVTSPAVTPDALVTILTSLIEHERFIVDATTTITRGNHGTRNAAAVLEIAAKFPEIAEREQWADRGLADLLLRYNWKGTGPYAFIYPDGATEEISPEVGRGDYGTLLQAMSWLRMLGRDMPRQLLDIQEKNIEYFAYISWPSELAWRAARKRRGPELPGRGDVDYIESGGTTGTIPEQTSYPLRSGETCYAGTYVMRSDWTPDAVALRVRFGPIQYKYSQSGLGDVGDIGVWGYGTHLIPHIYKHPRTGPFREYGDRSFVGDGRSENTISVDGHGQSRFGRVRYIDEPLTNPWVTTPVFDYVRGGYAFDPKEAPVTHTRAVLFMKPDYFVVLDTIEGDGEHDYRMKYQLHQDLTVVTEGVRVMGRSRNGPGVIVSPSRPDLALSVIEGQDDPFKEGWHLLDEKRAETAPALIYEWREQGPEMVETVICPVPRDGSPRMRLERSVEGTTVTLTVTRPEGTDVITTDAAGNLTLRRMREEKVYAAGRLGAANIEAPGLALAAPKAGGAYVVRDGQGYIAASNCGALVSIPGADVKVIEWQGR
ncbi:MAG: hypothetical protein HN742_31815 [Lentisphaerae bacterium]|nr:hypothetical protein [Lentisphaerota bacterium]MBT4815521.1 hypothetical protein [Lentisphaerota bacterium]MBT5606501.1 hypothetical protein [Lentisphaerota bacterium]MBT7062299.1 hypothetical protein [Lentisphaerota bacterium]MBT7846500.1 hypothetical protein [Lentisphaerota bacterium]